MKNWIKRFWIPTLIVLIVLVVAGIYSYNHWYVPYRNLKNGFVVVEGFNCPKGHLIKANLNSKIYHLPGGTYYNRTNAANGRCFDSVSHAKKQGFRKSYNN